MEHTGDKPRIFISYSHEDEKWKNRVGRHLGVLEWLLDLWDDHRIAGGDDWLSKIKEAINSCDVALLLISANFLTSQFILRKEVPDLLERCEKEGVRVIPVILEDCAWKLVSWLNPIQVRPKDGMPLERMIKHKKNTALTALTKEIADLLLASSTLTPKPDHPHVVTPGKIDLTALDLIPDNPTPPIRTGEAQDVPDASKEPEGDPQKDLVKEILYQTPKILAKTEESPSPAEELAPETTKMDLEECFQDIAHSLANKRVVFFLGPGINFDPGNSKEKSSLPPDDIDIASLIEDPKTSKQRQDQLWHDQELLFTRFELRRRSQFKINADHGNDEPLFKDLSNKLREDYEFNRIQEFLAQQASKIAKMRDGNNDLSQLMVITTNYDSGLEKAFEKEGLSIDVMYYSTGAKRSSAFYHKFYEINEKECLYSEDKVEKTNSHYEKFKFNNFGTTIERPIIIKLHGGVVYKSPQEYDTFMIAETHQIDFFQKAKFVFPRSLRFYLDTSDIVFLSYTANDADLRTILHYFFDKKDDLHSFGWHEYPTWEYKDIPKGWLVTQSPFKAAGQMNGKDYWKHWRVDLIECNCNKFVDLLQNYLEDHLK